MKLSFKIKNNKDHCHCVYLWFSERTVLGMWYGYHKNHDAIIIHFCEKCSRMKIGITFVHAFVYPKILMNKESNSTANESKWQFNRSIIYYLNVVPIVNDSFWMLNYKKVKKKTKNAQPRLELAPFERPIVVWCPNHWSTKATECSSPNLTI